jgi:uncharacterized protein DUF5670
MLMTIAIIVLAVWLLGIIFHIAAGLINLLLIACLILIIAHFLNRGRRDNTHI